MSSGLAIVHLAYSHEKLAMSVTVGQGKQITLEEFVKVTFYSQSVVLAGTETGPAHVGGLWKWNGNVGTGEYTAKIIARAGLLCRASSYAQVRGANQVVLQLLVALLNSNITPAFSTFENAGAELVSFITGNGYGYYGDSESTTSSFELFNTANLAPLKLTVEDTEELQSYPFLTIGLGGILAAASSNLIRMVDSVTALSCEAAGSGVEAYDAANFEVGRPHRGQMQSASNLRLLLDGSKRIGTVAKDKRCDMVSLQSAPQSTGPSRDVILTAVK